MSGPPPIWESASKQWVDETFIKEADKDGKLYARQNGAWIEILPTANPGPYLPLSGGTMTGQLTNNGGYYQSSGGWFYAQAGAIELRCTGSNIVVDCDAAINMRATNGINAESQLNLSQGIQSAGTLIINSNASTQITGSQGVYVYSPAYFTSSVQLESNRIFSKDSQNDDSLVIRGGNNPMIHLGSSNIHGYIYSNRIQANNFMSSEVDILQGGSGFQFYTNAPVEYRPYNQYGNSREAIKILTNAGGIGFYSTDGQGPTTSINNGSARFGGSFLEVYGDLNVGNNIHISQGTAYKPNGGMWENSSDARLKTDVEAYEDGLNKLIKLRPISFRFNDRAKQLETRKRYVGLAAEDVKKVMPQMVGIRRMKLDYDTEPTDTLTIDPSELLYTLINAVKQIDERLKKLEGK